MSIGKGALGCLCGILGLVTVWQLLLREDSTGHIPATVQFTGLRSKFRVTLEPKIKQKIPHIIHQTARTRKLDQRQEQLIESWRRHNPAWEYRFYDDEQAYALVAQDFPDWLAAYEALPQAVEKADFFRYMVVLRHGGIYADIDTECGMSLNRVLQPDDGFVAGWEDEFSSQDMAINFKFARQRQALQWVFAAVPGHPLLQELCEGIAHRAFDPSIDNRTDALFRTGPGPFTDAVVRHALQNPFSKANSTSRVRVLPRIAFGGLTPGLHAVSYFGEPRRAVAHWSTGSWKAPDFEAAWTERFDSRMKAMVLMRMPPLSELAELLFPVSTLTRHPFTVMTHIIGHGDRLVSFPSSTTLLKNNFRPCLANVEVESQVTKWGTVLAPGEYLLQKSPPDVFIDAWLGDESAGKVMLDIGSGPGVYSLAAASSGRTAHAFELLTRSSDSLMASMEYNVLPGQIHLHTAPAVGGGEYHNYTEAVHSWFKLPELTSARDVGAIRISIPGWESWILEQLKALLQRSAVRVLLMELYPQRPQRDDEQRPVKQLLEDVQAIGFNDIRHVGHMCILMQASEDLLSKPWLGYEQVMTQNRPEHQLPRLANDDLFQWCEYQQVRFDNYTSQLPVELPELFLLRKS